MAKYFVWISGLRGPEPQIWDEKDKTTEGKPIAALAKHELNPLEGNLSINELVNRYPYEAKP